jgi:hypothetical protein
MNWKLPNHLRWFAKLLREGGPLYPDTLEAFADVIEEAAKELELSRAIITRDPFETPIEEGDRANG